MHTHSHTHTFIRTREYLHTRVIGLRVPVHVTNTFTSGASGKSHLGVHVNHVDDVDYDADDDGDEDLILLNPPSIFLYPVCRFD